MIIDAQNLIAGRLATVAAKRSLSGESIDIINSEKAVITGSKKKLVLDFARKRQSKDMIKGPFFPRTPERILKRIIRGMLPYKTARGREALSRIKCHISVPDHLKGKDAETIEKADIKKIERSQYLTLEKLSLSIGWTK